jgi:hypothetical protein
VRTALYFVLTLYKWNDYISTGIPEETTLGERVFRQPRTRRRLVPLLQLFVRDEAAVFLVVTRECRVVLPSRNMLTLASSRANSYDRVHYDTLLEDVYRCYLPVSLLPKGSSF